MATFSVHFDGPITTDHKVPLRVLSKTYEHMQRAIDRAYLLETYGQIYKHARLTDDQYEDAEFLAEWPREGGIILDGIRAGAENLVDRVYQAVRPLFVRAMEEGLQNHETIGAQLQARKAYVAGMRARTQEFQSLIDNPRTEWSDAYSSRSIVKEVAQLVQMITPDRHEGSSIAIDLTGSVLYPVMEFDSNVAKRFYALISKRELAPAFIMDAKIRNLDRGNRYSKPKAKILNVSSNREIVLHLDSEQDFLNLHPYHTAESVRLYVAPLMEAGGFDVHGGDVYFLAVAA